ncbi:hypothetical protein LTR22_028411, partial [Elasticomyces elasticus]
MSWEIFAQQLGCQVSQVSMGGEGGFEMRASNITYPSYRARDVEPDTDSDSECEVETERQHGYRTLKVGEIRLLVLNPGSREDLIECFLEHYLARNAKPYLELSYMRDFLVNFRSESHSAVLWIDAVCINQTDNSERNAQVRLMKQVYEQADSVVIWLGEPADGTWEAFQAIEYFYRSFGLPYTQPEQSLASIPVKWIEERFAKIEKRYPHAWTGIRNLFNRPWWSRVWAYQEATAPAKNGRIVLCGPYTIDFAKILGFNALIKYLSGGYKEFAGFERFTGKSASTMDVYSKLRQGYYKQGKCNFLRLSDLLPTLRDSSATNPRDKLYSLIPISLDGADLLDVDYSLSVEEVYIDAAMNFIQKHKNLDILGHCTGTSRESAAVIQLPSW